MFPFSGCGQPRRYVFTVHDVAEDAHPAGTAVTLDWDGTREGLHLMRAATLTH